MMASSRTIPSLTAYTVLTGAAVLLLCTASLSTATVQDVRVVPLPVTPALNYCSFFNNRAPSAQPGLLNCTWFKRNSCCQQQEIQETFGRVKPLKGASEACLRYINYLMCYVCAPDQNIFYQNERLTVCEDFCNKWYHACKDAILKGSVISELYDSGKLFCSKRRFIVSNELCFNYDFSGDVNVGTSWIQAGGHRTRSMLAVLGYLLLIRLFVT